MKSLVSLLLSISFLMSAQHSPKGLVGYWAFDDAKGNTAIDSSGRGNTGTLVNGPTWGVGKDNGDVGPNGVNQYIAVPESSSLQFGSGSFSFGTWFNTSSPAYGHLISNLNNWNTPGWRLLISNGHVSARLSDGKTQISSTQSLSKNDGAWHHAMAVMNRADNLLHFYIDGTEILPAFSIAGVGSVTDPGAQLDFGANHCNGYPIQYFTGSLDEAYVYNRALSGQEVIDVMNDPGLGKQVPNIISFTANPAVITLGQFSSLSWVISGATSVSIDNNIGNQSNLTTGSVSVSPSQTTTYTITATNSQGSATASTTVTIGNVTNVTFTTVQYNIGTQGDKFVGNRQPQNVVTGDFDGDGKLDLVVAHTVDNSIYFLRGNGDGTFVPAVRIPITGAIIHGDLYIGDFNNDGNLDVFVSEDPLAEGLCYPIILLGNGDGTFQVRIDYGSSFVVPNTYARGWAVGDFNGDGKLDLIATLPNIVIGDCGGYIVLLGNGDGTFKRGQVVVGNPNVLHYSRWVAVGDLNGDGKLDLAFGDGLGMASKTGTAEVTIMLGNGDGTFRMGGHYPSPGTTLASDENLNPENVHLADLNHDGALDVIVSNYDDNINVLLGNGNGTFQPAVGYTVGEYPRAVTVADVDGDGKVDLIVSNIGSATGYIDNNQPGSVAVMLGNGDGTFQAPIQFLPFYFPGCALTADFNGDGWPDIAVTAMSEAGTTNDHAVGVMLNMGDKPQRPR